MTRRIGKIYIHIRRDTGQMYIGKTFQNEHRRWRKTCKKFTSYTNNPYLLATLKLIGWNGFDSEVICSVLDNSKINELESYFIELYKDKCMAPIGYNLKSYDDCHREQHSDVTKAKISAMKLGRPFGAPAWNKKANVLVNGVESRLCTSCAKIKPLEQFVKTNNLTQTGKLMTNQFHSHCKPCKAEYKRIKHPYQRKNIETVKESYKARGEAMKTKMKDHYADESKRRNLSLKAGGYKGVKDDGTTVTFECGHDLKKAGYQLSQVQNAMMRNQYSKGFKWERV